MLARLLVLFAGVACVLPAEDTIWFQRHFPGAIPERFEVQLAEDGRATYLEDGEEAVELAISASEVRGLFEQAAALDFFERPLASRRRVASTGAKILRYESGGTLRGEAHFDYSDVREARDLASWFVRLAETRQHLVGLERAYRFDRLGVNQALEHLEEAYERDRIVAPQLLVPILGRIAAHDRIVHLAKARAAGLLERIAARER